MSGSLFEQGGEVDADAVVEQNIMEYGIYTQRTKISNVIDGLKPINRRILLVHNTPVLRKVNAVVGGMMEKYHPYGDGAMADAISRMAQPFTTRATLMRSDSNVGDYGGTTSAQPRYLDVAASDLAIDVYFKGIDHSVFEMVPGEIDNMTEPNFFIPKLPMALLVAAFGMGIAAKSYPLNLNFKDVVKMTYAYTKLRLMYGEDPIPHSLLLEKLTKYTIPDTPIKNLLRNKSSVMAAHSQGNFKTPMITDGTLLLSPNSITILTLPYGANPRDAWRNVGKMYKEKGSNPVKDNIVSITDYGAENFEDGYDETCIQLILKRGVSPFAILDTVKKLIGFTKSNTPTYLFVVPSGKISYLDPLKIMEYWHNARKNAIQSELRIGLQKTGEEIRKVEAMIKIGDNVIEAATISNNAKDQEEACVKLMERFDLTRGQAVTIGDYRIKNMSKQSHADMQKHLDSLYDKVTELGDRFKQAHLQIFKDCDLLIKRHADITDRRCDRFVYLGYVQVMDGIIQFESYDEMYEIINRFSKYVNEIHFYPNGHKYHYLMDKNGIVDGETKLTLPKEMCGTKIVSSKNAVKYLMCLTDQKTVYRVNVGKSMTYRNEKLVAYIDQYAIGMGKDGLLYHLDPKSITSRKAAGARGVNTDLIYIGGCADINNFVLAYSNTKNEIVFQRVVNCGNVPNVNLKLPPMSVRKTHILGVFNPDEPICLNIPKHRLNKTTVAHIVIPDQEVLNEKEVIKVNTKAREGLTYTKHGISVLEIT